MTELLEQAIEELRKLPEPDQNETAQLLLDLLAKRKGPLKLDPQRREAIRRGLREIREGKIATDEDVAEVFSRYR